MYLLLLVLEFLLLNHCGIFFTRINGKNWCTVWSIGSRYIICHQSTHFWWGTLAPWRAAGGLRGVRFCGLWVSCLRPGAGWLRDGRQIEGLRWLALLPWPSLPRRWVLCGRRIDVFFVAGGLRRGTTSGDFSLCGPLIARWRIISPSPRFNFYVLVCSIPCWAFYLSSSVQFLSSPRWSGGQLNMFLSIFFMAGICSLVLVVILN
jgi:hypothetical protein